MSLLYVPGFNTVDEGGAFTVAVTGPATGTATVAAGKYAHASLAGVVVGYNTLAVATQTALNAVASGWTVTWSSTTGLYTIANATSFTLTWSGAGGARLRRALGFSTTVSSVTTATSDVRPYYLMISQIGARSSFSDVYEPDDLVEEAISDGGTAYGVAKDTSELYCDWTQSMETVENTLTRKATSAVPWTWQDFFKHCRMTHPFAVYGDLSPVPVYRLRAEGAAFGSLVRERVTPDWDDLWNVMFMTRELGRL
jgi:hypothetical protein